MIVTIFLRLKLIDENDTFLGLFDVVPGSGCVVFICKLKVMKIEQHVDGEEASIQPRQLATLCAHHKKFQT